jgi:two-component system chemotaxis response regulator CheB
LPSNYPVPILCVQHISKGFLGGLVDWLNSQCRLTVQIAVAGTVAQPGHVYFPPEDTHLSIDARGRLSTSTLPSVDGHRPSATALFDAVAKAYGGHAMGVLLTGMGGDGATGLQSIFKAGGVTIAQNETSCVVFGMPRMAIELGAAQYMLTPEEIAQALLRVGADRT